MKINHNFYEKENIPVKGLVASQQGKLKRGKFSLSDREIFTIKADSFKEVTPNHFSWLKEPEPAINTFVSWLREKGLDRIIYRGHGVKP